MDFIYNNPVLKKIRRKLRQSSTKSEQKLWRYLCANKLGVKWYRQYSIGNFIVDFCCPSKRTVIEIDGITHDSPEVQIRDSEKLKYLEALGYSVLRFGDEDVNKNPEGISEHIKGLFRNAP